MSSQLLLETHVGKVISLIGGDLTGVYGFLRSVSATSFKMDLPDGNTFHGLTSAVTGITEGPDLAIKFVMAHGHYVRKHKAFVAAMGGDKKPDAVMTQIFKLMAGEDIEIEETTSTLDPMNEDEIERLYREHLAKVDANAD